MATWSLEKERKKMVALRSITLSARAAYFLAEVMRKPKELAKENEKPAMIPQSRRKRIHRLAKAVDKADDDNGYIKTREKLQEDAQNKINAFVASTTDQEKINNQVASINSDLVIKGNENDEKCGSTKITFTLTEDDWSEIKKDWEMREWATISHKDDALFMEIDEALEAPTKLEA